MKFKYLIIFTCFFSTVFQSCYREPIYCKYSDKVVRQFVKEAYNKDKMELFGEGGAFMEDIKSISLSFAVYDQPYTVEEARRLYISNVNNLISKINEDKQVRPYLHDFPFTIKNTDLSISFLLTKSKKRYSESPYIALVMKKNNYIDYAIYDPVNDRLETFYTESYEEALMKIQKEEMNCCNTNKS